MDSVDDTPKGWVAPFGCPGIKACSRLLRDFRSVPRPSSPLGAKASARCPSHAQTQCAASRRRQRPPCTGATNAGPPEGSPPSINPATRQAPHSYAHICFHAPEPCNRRHARTAPDTADAEPGQTPASRPLRTSRACVQAKPANADPARCRPSRPARPGARQNLIHLSKHHLRRRARQALPNGSNPAPRRQTRHAFRDIWQWPAFRPVPGHPGRHLTWRRSGSNR